MSDIGSTPKPWDMKYINYDDCSRPLSFHLSQTLLVAFFQAEPSLLAAWYCNLRVVEDSLSICVVVFSYRVITWTTRRYTLIQDLILAVDGFLVILIASLFLENKLFFSRKITAYKKYCLLIFRLPLMGSIYVTMDTVCQSIRRKENQGKAKNLDLYWRIPLHAGFIDQNRKGHLVVTRPVQWKGNLTTINKPVFPFVWKVPACGFVISQSTQFTLTPYISANRFNINFLAADEYFFHFRVDFPNSNRASKIVRHYFHAAVVRNSTKNGCWQVEEREIGQFPFSKGITYDIRMIAYERSIAVDVNGVPFIKFNYREGDNPAKIDKITVEGDCILQRFVHLA
uniref:Galectin n=1 Tax=Heterorhabditis bacteriophora TaxID=37862 RepID=A0A1I7XJF8_HETBA